MGADSKIANALSKHLDVIERGAEKLPLQRGDRVVDAGYAHLPVKPLDGLGNIVKVSGRIAVIAWDDGSVSNAPVSTLQRLAREFIATPHDSAYELPAFRADDKVILGNGNRGKVLAEVTGPTGFKSFKIKVTDSVNPQAIGTSVFATVNGMIKVSSINPDVVAAIHDPLKGVMAVVGCEIAATDKAQEIGLQKYSSLPTDHGMLFPYDPPRHVTFHMGSVSFPIDILFVTEHGTIQKIEASCEPGYDSRWKSLGPVAAVIEVNGGFCSKRNIYAGMRVSIGTPKAAQETFDPARTDTHLYQSPATTRPAPSDRFKDRQTPDQVLETSQPLDGAHFETQMGYDPITYHDDPNAPNMRMASNPLSTKPHNEYPIQRCQRCKRETISYQGKCRACGTPVTNPQASQEIK